MIIIRAVVFIFLALFGDLDSNRASAGNKGWLAFGDIRGYLAPCGCDPRTDLGGVERLASFIGAIRRRNSDVDVIHLGNSLHTDDSLKSQTVLDALREIKPTISLLNRTEYNYLKQKKQWQPPAVRPWILSHLPQHHPLAAWVDESFETPTSIYLGYVHGLDDIPMWGTDIQQRFQKQLTLNGSQKQKVLLFAGPDSVLHAVVASKIFDLIISSSSIELTQKPNQLEKEEPGRLLRIQKVYSVPSFGQGALLGGGLETDPLLCKRDSKPLTRDHKLFQLSLGCSIFHWLNRDYDNKNVLTSVMAKYRQQVEHNYRQLVKERKKLLINSQFVGSKACQGCHQTEYQRWTESQHSKAFGTLVEKKSDRDPNCVGCHVLGFDQPGGFVDQETTAHFEHVQCENCHGPRKKHLANPFTQDKTSSPSQGAFSTCVSCHHPPHSSHFQLKEYWQKIKH